MGLGVTKAVYDSVAFCYELRDILQDFERQERKGAKTGVTLILKGYKDRRQFGIRLLLNGNVKYHSVAIS